MKKKLPLCIIILGLFLNETNGLNQLEKTNEQEKLNTSLIDIPQLNIFQKPKSDLPLFIKGSITIKNSLEKVPEFRVYFEGQEAISDEDGFFTFSIEDKDLMKYKLIITRKIQHVINQRNTFKNLKLIPEKNYLCYSFKKLGQDQGIWLQKEKNLDHKQFLLSKNNIIILIDPKYVEKVEEWNIDLPDNFIKIPKIILKKVPELETLKRVSAKSLLSLEESTFHERVGRKNNISEAKNNKIKVTLP